MIKRVNRLKYNWSDKHKEYMRRTQHCSMNIAEGSIRSGKTTDNIFCFAYDLKHSKDKIHLATASTQPTAKLVIGDCDGYGLEHIFRGQCRWGKYKGNECLIIKGIDTGYKEKIVLFCGGAKADSYKKFRGMSIGLWIATEINLHHENTIREAQRRQINADIKRFYWDLNPGSPNEPIYSEFIDKWEQLSKSGVLRGGYNFQRFNIFDNINLSKENLESELSKYTVGDVFYRRDILGERCIAEGLVYPFFNEELHCFDELPKDFYEWYVSVDYGTQNPCAMQLWAVNEAKRCAYLTKEYYYDGRKEKRQKTDADYYDDLFDLCRGKQIINVIVDPSAASFKAEIRKHGYFSCINANNDVIDGIRFTGTCMSSGRILVSRDCKNTILEFGSYLWDDKSGEDKVIKENDHAMDALRYMVHTVLRRLGF